MNTKEEIMNGFPRNFRNENRKESNTFQEKFIPEMMEQYAEQFKPKWISVHDSLPKENEFVLVLYSESCMDVSRIKRLTKEKLTIGRLPEIRVEERVTISWENINTNSFINGKIIQLDGICLPTEPVVSHWMKLPEKP